MRRKLTDRDVAEIRRIYAQGEIPRRVLASRYRVHGQTIGDIVSGRRRQGADPDRADKVEHMGIVWYRRNGRYWYKAPTGSGRAYEWRDACTSCGQGFFAARSRIDTQGLYCSISCSRTEQFNPRWLGSEVGYRGAHKRVEMARGKAGFCNILDCDTGCTTYHWANLTGDYADVWDYESMCVSHHRRYDYARARYLTELAGTDTTTSF